MYYKLKTSFLEETLSDALDEDSFDLSILENSSQTELRMSSSFSELSTPDVSALTNENSIILPLNNSGSGSNSMALTSNSRFSQEFDAEISSTVNENAWNEVPKSSSTAAKESSNSGNGSTLRKSLSNKLFRNSSFLMRNPRKSLSKNSLTSQNSQSSLSSSQASSRKESFPDLETILSQKSKQQTENDDNDEKSQSQTEQAPQLDAKTISAVTVAAASATTINSVKHLDDEWLKRCSLANSIDDFGGMNSNGLMPSTTADKPKVFGISNINAAALAKFEQKQILDSPEIGGAKTMLSFDMSNMNLAARNSFVGDSAMHLDVINDGEINGMPDDDEIANSEDETEINTSRQIRSIRGSIKRKRSEIEDVVPSTKLKASTSGRVTPIDGTIVNKNQQSDEPKEGASVTVRKAKSKARTKVQAAPKAKMIETKPKVEIVKRRSSRNVNKATSYKEIEISDLKSKQGDGVDIDDEEREEEDPFAGDDSDNDPNFSISQSPKSKQMIKHDLDSSSEGSDTEKPKAVKKEIAAKPVRQRIARVKKAPASAAASSAPKLRNSIGVRKTKTVRKKIDARKSDPQNSSIDENGGEPPETPDDYLIEFGIDQISSVPRIPVAELRQNTVEFSKYLCSLPATTATAANARPNGTRKSVAGASAAAVKTSMAREKLESKVAAGKLNENYVRLNLRKKVFVRGKKTMNFSRYKKKLWKSQKAAALSGPDMDMRGCDGGILMCFQCGMPGHFAQNCKVKSK